MSYDISDYVDVKTRIELFYAKFPEGSIQFEFMGLMEGNPEFIWGIARAYRHPEDPRPFTGTCSELAQGKTAFTRGSELANLETSAIGRCIGSAGLGLGKSMATKQEVNAAQARQIVPAAAEEEHLDAWGLPSDPEAEGQPKCMHGAMNRKTGISDKTGKPYSGWTCHAGKCKAIWDRS
jgi:hypothetical protein